MAEGKSKNNDLGKLFLIFFRFQRNLGHQLPRVMSNIQGIEGEEIQRIDRIRRWEKRMALFAEVRV
jgi:hypothetical protein